MPVDLSRFHPLASVARRICGHVEPFVDVACSSCWELAIRDDERIVVEFGLTRELQPDPTYIDEIAVDRACAGDAVALTVAEQYAAVRQLRRQGLSATRISQRLRIPYRTVAAVPPVSDTTKTQQHAVTAA